MQSLARRGARLVPLARLISLAPSRMNFHSAQARSGHRRAASANLTSSRGFAMLGTVPKFFSSIGSVITQARW